MKPLDDRSEEEKLADKETKARKDLDQAHRAENTLNSDWYRQRVEQQRDKALKEFCRSGLEDVDIWRRCRLKIALLEDDVNNLSKDVDTGKLAKRALEEVEKGRERLRRFGKRFRRVA